MELDQIKREDYNGSLAEIYPETDFRLGEDLILPAPRTTYYDKKTSYQQTEAGAYSCTVHAAMGAMTDQIGFVFDLEHRKIVWKMALEQGADPNVGWYISRAVDLVRNYTNILLGQKIMSFRVSIGTLEFNQAIEAGYSVATGFNGNAAYNMDKIDNDTLEGLTFGSPTYGHSIRITKGTEGNYNIIVDNYPKTSAHNVYLVDKSHFDQLVKNKVFMPSGYIFVNKEDWDKANKIISSAPLWAKTAVNKAITKGLVTADTNLELIVGDAELEDWLFKLGFLTSKMGNLSLLRLLVVTERFGRL